MDAKYQVQQANCDDITDNTLKEEEIWKDLVFSKNPELALFYLIDALNKDYTTSNNTSFRLLKDGVVICSK